MQRLMPMSKCEVKATIENAFAMLDFELTFTNNSEQTIEASYEFPVETDITIASLKAQLGDKEVEAVIKEK